jgi:hypothetical protein
MSQRYIPEPVPADSEYIIGAHYFPGWREGTHFGWGKITPYPERKPLLGWYDEGDPEVTDWEIKWALEHGISCFIYCWYRVGHEGPVRHRLGHAIHDGFFHARFKDKFKFAIMWENQNAGCSASVEDLVDNLFHFWMDNYFSHPSYLRIDGKPVLCIYDVSRLCEFLGANVKIKREAVRKALDKLREEAVRCGLSGLWLFCEYRHQDAWNLQRIRDCGFDCVFAYCWHTKNRYPTAEEAINTQLEAMNKWRKLDIIPFVPTISVGWDPMPWKSDNPATPWLHPDKMTRWYLEPPQYETLCKKVKAMMAELPETSPGRKMLMLDNWNEWGEGHFISPHKKHGFGYLDVIRKLFTTAPQVHIDLTPADVGLGPYNKLFKG